jgi:hypothetical protein
MIDTSERCKCGHDRIAHKDGERKYDYEGECRMCGCNEFRHITSRDLNLKTGGIAPDGWGGKR